MLAKWVFDILCWFLKLVIELLFDQQIFRFTQHTDIVLFWIRIRVFLLMTAA